MNLKEEGKIIYMLGDAEELGNIRKQEPLVPFAEETMHFLSALSERIFLDHEVHKMPEAAAFAFWCRRAHLEQMRAEYDFSKEKRLGRGVSLHFAPFNMPVLFAFTLAAGMLAGNSMIVRLPGKESVQERLIVSHIRGMLKDGFSQFQGRLILCRYPHDQGITDALSALCDVRVIWGSDYSVLQIRKSPLPPRAVDLPFASRGSAALFHARSVGEAVDMEALAKNFYQDTYLNDQNACSSPLMIYWLGTPKETESAKERFWAAVLKLLEQKDYPISASLAVQKLEGALALAAVFPGAKIRQESNRLVRVSVPVLEHEMWDYTVPGGFFIESEGETLEGIFRILNGYCQTLSTYGMDNQKLAEEIVKRRISGVDRVVQIGHALDFSLVWDGFDLITSMSRRILC